MANAADRDFAVEDAEIEAEFQRVAGTSRASGKRKRGLRHMGAPLAFWRVVCAVARGKADVVVALSIYRRVRVSGSTTVTLPQRELTELGVDRPAKSRSLARLARGGLIGVERTKQGTTTRITLLWEG